MRKELRQALVALALGVGGAAGPAWAGPLEDGQAAYDRGDYAAALRIWTAISKSNAEAQTRIGAMYEFGDGVEIDYAEALRWYRLAANRGNAEAQAGLGYLYETGQGAAEDDAEAARWYRLAADQGYAYAQTHLGGLYENGDGVAQGRCPPPRNRCAISTSPRGGG
jgi:TPR repeat protein